MAGVPVALLLLVGLIGLVAVLFLGLRRPMYEIMAVAFVALVAASGQWAKLGEYLLYPAQDSLFFTIFAFLFVAVIFDRTRAIQDIITILLALIGRFRGGAGYVALVSSAFMASLSGTGPGNVAATGVFTIPSMKRSGYPPHVAATTEMSASMLGNIIPPAGIVFLSFGVYDTFRPDQVSLSTWLVASYAIGGWFLLQRLVTLIVMCRASGVTAVPAAELPQLRPALRKGWRSLLLPLVIFVPLLVDTLAKDFTTARLGSAGADAFSSAILMFTPALAGAYALAIGRRHFAGAGLTPRTLLTAASDSLTKVAPVGLTIYFAYAISQAFQGLQADQEIRDWVVDLHLPLPALVVILPVFFGILGMVLPGTAQVAILGGAMVGVFATLGGDPLLLAILLPAMTGALEGMTPPLALGLYVAMGIADSRFGPTAKLALVWVGCHLLTAVLLLAGLLPVPGV